MTRQNELTPIVLVGAARSGTKAIRDALSIASGVPAVPYDVSYVWRHGNESAPDDRQLPADARPRTRRMVCAFLSKYADESGRVIEKTVGTSLRVGYVNELLPRATFVHLIRNGVDAAESTRRQWLAPVDYGYLRDKLRHFPPRLLTSYGRRHALSIVRQRLAHDGRVATWGPRYPGMDQDATDEDLLTVCARQWWSSVAFSRSDFADFGIDHIEVRYEDLVNAPREWLSRVVEFAGLPEDSDRVAAGAATIRSGHGGGSDALCEGELAMLDREIGDLLDELGYDRPVAEAP